MIRSKLALLADNIIIDRNSNNVSVIDIIEAISVPTFPIVLPRLTALLVLEREENDPAQITWELVFKVADVEKNRYQVVVDFSDKLRTRSIVAFGGYLIQEVGVLRAEFVYNNAVLDAYDIEVATLAAPQVEVAQA